MAARIIEAPEALKNLVGQEAGVSDWLEITQSMIDAFADCTHDRQWIHVDRERARVETSFGSTIAHGFLTLSLISHLFDAMIEVRGCRMIINYGLNRVRFPCAVPAGSRIRGRIRLLAVEEKESALQATWHVTVEKAGADKPAMIAEWLVRYGS
jgi:acyl dehydratase